MDENRQRAKRSTRAKDTNGIHHTITLRLSRQSTTDFARSLARGACRGESTSRGLAREIYVWKTLATAKYKELGEPWEGKVGLEEPSCVLCSNVSVGSRLYAMCVLPYSVTNCRELNIRVITYGIFTEPGNPYLHGAGNLCLEMSE